jgi:virulence-associated protein VagC
LRKGRLHIPTFRISAASPAINLPSEVFLSDFLRLRESDDSVVILPVDDPSNEHVQLVSQEDIRYLTEAFDSAICRSICPEKFHDAFRYCVPFYYTKNKIL